MGDELESGPSPFCEGNDPEEEAGSVYRTLFSGVKPIRGPGNVTG